MYRVKTVYVGNMVSLKSLAISVSNISPEFLIDPNRLILDPS